MRFSRVMIDADPYVKTPLADRKTWTSYAEWPCSWISLNPVPKEPFAALYRRSFLLKRSATIRIHVTADNRYDLFCDGIRIGRGPERGDVNHWFFETYDITLPAGSHRLVGKVWTAGCLNDTAGLSAKMLPHAQLTAKHGFLLGAEGIFHELLSTGIAKWEAKRLPGISFDPPGDAWGVGYKNTIDARHYIFDHQKGQGKGWTPAIKTHPGFSGHCEPETAPYHRLHPATLPAQIEKKIPGAKVRHVDSTGISNAKATQVEEASCILSEIANWQKMLTGKASVTIPANTTRRVILDLGLYHTAYPVLITSGGQGALIRLSWAESLFHKTKLNSVKNKEDAKVEEQHIKKNREDIDGKIFIGVSNSFLPDGAKNRVFETLWWESGRYIEVIVETRSKTVTISDLSLYDTHYPVLTECRLEADDKRWNDVFGISFRTLQMCMHETYMDCPYYEQLQYIGDTRLQALATYMITADDRLPRKAITQFKDSFHPDMGLLNCCYPVKYRHIIPPFTLWWIGMLYDHALWRNDKAFIRSMMPVMRRILDTFVDSIDEKSGLMKNVYGWNFMDWVPAWNAGAPPSGFATQYSSILNWHLVYTLKLAAELEEYAGEHDYATGRIRIARDLVKAIDRNFWNVKRNMYADDLSHKYFSEHAQCLALLSGETPARRLRPMVKSLYSDKGIARTTIYFAHYLFETTRITGNTQVMEDYLEELWFKLKDNGQTTLPETPEPTRSDCHAWGAHPVYHFFATILGIRPEKLGSRNIIIRPNLGRLQNASGIIPLPSGRLAVSFIRKGKRIMHKIRLPRGYTATLESNGKKVRIQSCFRKSRTGSK